MKYMYTGLHKNDFDCPRQGSSPVHDSVEGAGGVIALDACEDHETAAYMVEVGQRAGFHASCP
jgi:hypothetical protein